MHSLAVFNPKTHSSHPAAIAQVWSIGRSLCQSIKPLSEIVFLRKLRRKVCALQLCVSLTIIKDLSYNFLEVSQPHRSHLTYKDLP